MFTDDIQFENEIRRIARILWPSAEGGGALMEDGRERDAVFETDDFVNIIECTVSRSRQKAVDDSAKLAKLIRKYEVRYPTKHLKGWFITLHEPTADQRTVVQGHKEKLVAVSYDQFRARLVDARSYIIARQKYPFGSVRDPNTGKAAEELDYIPLDILDHEGGTHTTDSIAAALDAGGQFVIVGDYGAGKSSTLREVFLKSAKRFWDARTSRFPLLLNLRDHYGQDDPSEALDRHARKVGFASGASLVRAWRAGYALLILDGFDEIASAGWAGRTRKLRELRYRSMELVRRFVRETPADAGLLVAGRQHFFDNAAELQSSLGVTSQVRHLSLSEFSSEQVANYLRNRGWKEAIPDWLPSRPLLLGYLASRGLLESTLVATSTSSPAVGWDALLGRVSEREAEIVAGMDPDTVRTLIERLATVARSSADGLGPLSPTHIIQAFGEVVGSSPDDQSAVLLQRLPGLGGHSAEDGARVFVDQDFAAAAAAGDVFRFVTNPFSTPHDVGSWQTSLLSLGIEVVAHKTVQSAYTAAKVGAALVHACSSVEHGTLAADVARTLQSLNSTFEGPKTYIREAMIPHMELSSRSGDLSRIEFQDCIVLRLEVDGEVDASRVPAFTRCFFNRVEGCTSSEELPQERFRDDCTFDEFESPAATSNAILELPLPLGSRVLLTLLKKLYAQAGHGRRESALYRGLDQRSREKVPDLLALLRREGFALRTRMAEQTVWLPTRDNEARKRALSMLANPARTSDPLFVEAGSI